MRREILEKQLDNTTEKALNNVRKYLKISTDIYRIEGIILTEEIILKKIKNKQKKAFDKTISEIKTGSKILNSISSELRKVPIYLLYRGYYDS